MVDPIIHPETKPPEGSMDIRDIVRQVGRAAALTAQAALCEELQRLGVPVSTINAAIENAAGRVDSLRQTMDAKALIFDAGDPS